MAQKAADNVLSGKEPFLVVNNSSSGRAYKFYVEHVGDEKLRFTIDYGGFLNRKDMLRIELLSSWSTNGVENGHYFATISVSGKDIESHKYATDFNVRLANDMLRLCKKETAQKILGKLVEALKDYMEGELSKKTALEFSDALSAFSYIRTINSTLKSEEERVSRNAVIDAVHETVRTLVVENRVPKEVNHHSMENELRRVVGWYLSGDAHYGYVESNENSTMIFNNLRNAGKLTPMEDEIAKAPMEVSTLDYLATLIEIAMKGVSPKQQLRR